MHFYMSGTPRNDILQRQENELCSHRLFSLHGDYQRAVHKWLDDVIAAPEYPYPKYIMLDSGAFTAWNAGGEVTLDEVFDSYALFEEKAGDLFEEIWMVNLDKIPGKRGQDPTYEEVKHALEVSDINYKRLVDRFGERILPVYHQGEEMERCLELAEMADYICASPRNDLPEGERQEWADKTHFELRKVKPHAKTHGLATTGNNMLKEVRWTSVDSAAWVLHAGFGKVDIFEGDKYRNYFVSNDARKAGLARQHIGGVYVGDGTSGEIIIPDKNTDEEGLLTIATMSQSQRDQILAIAAEYGFDKKALTENSRARSIICMGELAKFCHWATEYQNRSGQQGYLGFGPQDGD